VIRSADAFSLPFAHVPQEMTGYVRLIEGGSIAGNSGIAEIRAASGAKLQVYTVGSTYRVDHANGINGTVSSNAAATPTIGQRYEFRFVLYRDGGVQAWGSVNGGAEATTGKSAVPANGLASAWGDTALGVGRLNGSSTGFNAFRNLMVARGIQDMDYFRKRVNS
jgi:hypothetical protein